MNKLALAIMTGTVFAFAGGAQANDPVRHPIDTTKEKVRAEKVEDRMEDQAKADYKAKKAEADGHYKAAKERCSAKHGADERACKADAKAEHDRVVKDLKVSYDAAKRDADRAGEVAHDTRR